MALTTEFLEGLGVEKDLQGKIFAEHSKTLGPKLEELRLAQEKITELGEQLKKAPTSDTVTSLQAKIAEYETTESQRIENEKKAKEGAVIDNAILSAVGERKFVNDFTKDSIFTAVKTELAKDENKGKGASEVFESLVKDKDNIFINERQNPKMPNFTGATLPNGGAAILDAKYKDNPFYNNKEN